MAEYLLCGEFGLGFGHKCFPVTSGYHRYLFHPQHQLALFNDYHHALKKFLIVFVTFVSREIMVGPVLVQLMR